jgi:quinol-cytochrome oxidoreductase complex cytochrome b subunit
MRGKNTMDLLWKIIGLAIVPIMIFGIVKGGELDYLDGKKIKDYTLKDVMNVVIFLLLIFVFMRLLDSLFD